MKVEINKLTPEGVDVSFFKKFAEKVVRLVKLNIPELSIVFTCDARIKALNKKYRKRNGATDVLAFDCGLPFGGQGEIFICIPQAKRQAKELKHSLKEELEILLIHGMLHLSGYNDDTKKQRDEMFKQQNIVLLKIKNSPR